MIDIALVPILLEVEPVRIGVIASDIGKLEILKEDMSNECSVAETVVKMVKENVPVDIRRLSIIPIGFFDSFVLDKINRKITLAYKVILYPGTPISTKIGFKTYDELGKLNIENSEGDLRIIRAAIANF